MINTWLGHWRLAAEAAGEAEKRGGHVSVFYRALGYMGKAEEARRQSTSLNLAPHDLTSTRALIRALIASHRPDEAWALMNREGWLEPSAMSLSTRHLVWRTGKGNAVPTAEILDAIKAGKQYVDTAVTSLGDAQRWDDAAALLDRWGPPSRNQLFSVMRKAWAPLRKTPQFWALMEREGLVKYWHDSGQWPDFCSSEPVCQKYR